jgi:hypothetical protein
MGKVFGTSPGTHISGNRVNRALTLVIAQSANQNTG